MKPSGYSGTPLAKKLGIKPEFRIRRFNQPDYYYDLFSDLPEDIKELTDKKSKKDFIHYFAKSTAPLNKDIRQFRQGIEENGMIGVSWYKKSAKIETDLHENIIRDIALSNRLIYVKILRYKQSMVRVKTCDKTKRQKKMKRTTEGYAANSVFGAIAFEVVNLRSVLLRNPVLSGKENTYNPLLHIHANRFRVLNR